MSLIGIIRYNNYSKTKQHNDGIKQYYNRLLGTSKGTLGNSQKYNKFATFLNQLCPLFLHRTIPFVPIWHLIIALYSCYFNIKMLHLVIKGQIK